VTHPALAELADGTWTVTYPCGHSTYGITTIDRRRALRSNCSAIECHQMLPASASVGTGSPSDNSETSLKGRTQSTHLEDTSAGTN